MDHPFQVLERINVNVYIIDVSGEYGVNVADLTLTQVFIQSQIFFRRGWCGSSHKHQGPHYTFQTSHHEVQSEAIKWSIEWIGCASFAQGWTWGSSRASTRSDANLVVTQPTIKIEIWFWKIKIGLINLWYVRFSSFKNWIMQDSISYKLKKNCSEFLLIKKVPSLGFTGGLNTYENITLMDLPQWTDLAHLQNWSKNWCEPRDHVVTQPTRKDTNSQKAK